MLKPDSREAIERYWAAALGCAVEEPHRQQLLVTRRDGPSLLLLAYIVTHAAHRGRGHARAALAVVTRLVIERGLVAQYRTLESNAPSLALALARRLGFERWATSLAIRLGD